MISAGCLLQNPNSLNDTHTMPNCKLLVDSCKSTTNELSEAIQIHYLLMNKLISQDKNMATRLQAPPNDQMEKTNNKQTNNTTY